MGHDGLIVALFTDNEKRVWDLAISVDAVKRVRARCGVDLLARNLPELLERIVGDYVLLVDIIFVIAQPQAEKLGVEPEDFGRALGGDSLDAATNAFLDSLADFTPNLSDRARVRKLIATVRKAAVVIQRQADEMVERGTKEFMKSLRTGEPSTSSPESQASTPAT